MDSSDHEDLNKPLLRTSADSSGKPSESDPSPVTSSRTDTALGSVLKAAACCALLAGVSLLLAHPISQKILAPLPSSPKDTDFTLFGSLPVGFNAVSSQARLSRVHSFPSSSSREHHSTCGRLVDHVHDASTIALHLSFSETSTSTLKVQASVSLELAVPSTAACIPVRLPVPVLSTIQRVWLHGPSERSSEQGGSWQEESAICSAGGEAPTPDHAVPRCDHLLRRVSPSSDTSSAGKGSVTAAGPFAWVLLPVPKHLPSHTNLTLSILSEPQASFRASSPYEAQHSTRLSAVEHALSSSLNHLLPHVGTPLTLGGSMPQTAEIRLSVSAPKHLHVLASPALESLGQDTDERRMWRFKPLRNWSDNMFAVAVGQFHALASSKDAAGRDLTIWSLPGSHTEDALASMHVLNSSLTTWEALTGQKLEELEKVDMLVWNGDYIWSSSQYGLVFMDRWRTLWNARTSSASELVRMAHIICHEVGHHWYAGLVQTLDDHAKFFVEESTTSFSETYCVSAALPGLANVKLYEQHFAPPWGDSRGLHMGALYHALQELTSPLHEGETVSVSTVGRYAKGTALLRMIRDFMDSTIRKGAMLDAMRNFVATFRHQVARDNDLVMALAAQLAGVPYDEIPWGEPTPLSPRALDCWYNRVASWVYTPGIPVVRLQAERDIAQPDQVAFRATFEEDIDHPDWAPLSLLPVSLSNATAAPTANRHHRSGPKQAYARWQRVCARNCGCSLPDPPDLPERAGLDTTDLSSSGSTWEWLQHSSRCEVGHDEDVSELSSRSSLPAEDKTASQEAVQVSPGDQKSAVQAWLPKAEAGGVFLADMVTDSPLQKAQFDALIASLSELRLRELTDDRTLPADSADNAVLLGAAAAVNDARLLFLRHGSTSRLEKLLGLMDAVARAPAAMQAGGAAYVLLTPVKQAMDGLMLIARADPQCRATLAARQRSLFKPVATELWTKSSAITTHDGISATQDQIFTAITAASIVPSVAQLDPELAASVCSLIANSSALKGLLQASQPDVFAIVAQVASSAPEGCPHLDGLASQAWADATTPSKLERFDGDKAAVILPHWQEMLVIAASTTHNHTLQMDIVRRVAFGTDEMGLRDVDRVAILKHIILATPTGYQTMRRVVKEWLEGWGYNMGRTDHHQASDRGAQLRRFGRDGGVRVHGSEEAQLRWWGVGDTDHNSKLLAHHGLVRIVPVLHLLFNPKMGQDAIPEEFIELLDDKHVRTITEQLRMDHVSWQALCAEE